RVRIHHEEFPVSLAGGEIVMLRRPLLSIDALAHGPLAEDAMLSARIAPAMGGMGLIEAIAPNDLLAHADPDDADGDGISGRPNRVRDNEGNEVLGRFGWKAIQPTVALQTA